FITKIYQALAPDGIFVSIHEGMTHNRTRPASFALSWLPVSMMWQELALDRGQIADAMAEAGFKTICSRPISYGLGTMELDIARK
ncbi:MAG: methyltransferase type 12, partial [Desulfobacterales bacterium]